MEVTLDGIHISVTSEEMKSILRGIYLALEGKGLFSDLLGANEKPSAIPPSKPEKELLEEPLSSDKMFHGFPVEWKKTTESIIRNRLQFKVRDVIGPGRYKASHYTSFLVWLKSLGETVDVIKDPKTKTLTFIPFCWENGVKILASSPPPKDRQRIKGAALKPVIRWKEDTQETE